MNVTLLMQNDHGRWALSREQVELLVRCLNDGFFKALKESKTKETPPELNDLWETLTFLKNSLD